jgi:uncharacterized membrane-anchored protein YjiN (DUF445 family)
VKQSMILVLVAAALALAACGESTQDKAQSQVCDARADIQKQVSDLSSLTLATASVDGVQSKLKAIRSSLQKIADAQGDLNADRKRQVQAANQAFRTKLSSIVSDLGDNLSLATAATQLKDAASKLADTYRQTLGRVDCG